MTWEIYVVWWLVYVRGVVKSLLCQREPINPNFEATNKYLNGGPKNMAKIESKKISLRKSPI